MPANASRAVAPLLVALALAAPARAAGPTFESCWADLEKNEAEAARALLWMSDRPKEAVAFLKEKLRPLSVDEEQVRYLLRRLGSEDEKVWKPAFEALEYFDPRLALDLVSLMDEYTDPPARQRLVAVLSNRDPKTLEGKTVALRKFNGQNGEDNYNFFAEGSWWAEPKVARLNSYGWDTGKKKWTRAVRAIVLLEHVHTPEAVAVLRDLAAGHPEAQPTREAAAALARVGAAR